MDVIAGSEAALLDLHGVRHAVHEQQRGERYADFDRHRQIEEDREQERHQEHDAIAEGGGHQDGADVAELGDIPGDEGENGRERRKWDVGEHRRRDQG